MPHDYTPEINAAFAAYEETRAKVLDLRLVRFEGGPYYPPAVQIGDWVECARFGSVRIVDWSDGPLPWPRCHLSGTKSLILFEDLERAVQIESRLAIRLAWGAGSFCVTQWRKLAGIHRFNQGDRARKQSNAPQPFTPERDTESTGDARVADGFKTIWTPDRVAQMGVLKDREIAAQIGCLAATVGIERRRRGIKPQQRRGTRPVLPTLDGDRVRARRLELGLSQRALALRLSYDGSRISSLERGGSPNVKPHLLDKLASALECQPNDLLAADNTDAGADGASIPDI